MTFSKEYIVIRTYAGFRHPDRMMRGQTVRGGEHFVPRPCWYFTFLHVGRHFRNFPEICHVEKKNQCDQGRLELMSLKVLNLFYTPRARLPCMRSQNIKYWPFSDISGTEECKIPAWTRDKMFWHRQGAFSFPELQFSRGELHFD